MGGKGAIFALSLRTLSGRPSEGGTGARELQAKGLALAAVPTLVHPYRQEQAAQCLYEFYGGVEGISIG